MYCTTMAKLIDARDDWIVVFSLPNPILLLKNDIRFLPILVVVQIVLTVSESYPKVCL